MVKTRSITKKELSEKTVTTKIVVERVSKQTKKKGKKKKNRNCTLRPVTGDDEARPTVMLEDYSRRTLRPVTAEDDARAIFMLEDYSIRHPLPPYDKSESVEVDGRKCVEWDYAGRLEWREMSAADKAPYFAKLKKKSEMCGMLPP